MPTISRFFGIVITMYHREHNPPHFHARYAGHKAEIGLNPIAVIEGNLPRALAMVIEWAALHRQALLENWERCRRMELPNPLPPLS